MRVRWISLLLLFVVLLAGVPELSLQAVPDVQPTRQPLRGRTRPIRVPRRAPNRESGVNSPGGLSSCRTSVRDSVVYYSSEGTIQADGFPGNSWVLGIASPRDDLSQHIVFWVQADSSGWVFLPDTRDILSAGADPAYTILVGSNGQIRGLCLRAVFDTYGNPTNLYNEYARLYPVEEEIDLGELITGEISSSANLCLHIACQPELSTVASGGFHDVIDMSSGVVYAINPNGDLLWYRHDGWETGEPIWAEVNGSQWVVVGYGWAEFQNVFPGEDGVVYGILPDGRLLWYRNDCWFEGEACWEGPVEVGQGWNTFKNVFAADAGVVYAINPNGDLLWYRHDGWETGEPIWAEVNGSQWVAVGNGW